MMPRNNTDCLRNCGNTNGDYDKHFDIAHYLKAYRDYLWAFSDICIEIKILI